MRRTSWFRPLALFIGVWLPLFIGEPNLLSPCPTHGAFAVAAGQASPAHHHGHAAGGSHHSSPKHDEKDCSCIGCCTPGVARASVADAPVAIVAVATYEPHTGFPQVDAYAPAAPEFSRPYPTGPPRV